MHWSAGDYESVYPSYHYCIAWYNGIAYVVETNDLRANMRDVYASDAPYAAHTYRRNSFAAGVSVMGMRDATPQDFGAWPMTGPQIDALCLLAARIAAFYRIEIAPHTMLTHAEAAIADGYFGAGSEETRWDIARLAADRAPLSEEDARNTAEELRWQAKRVLTSITSTM